MVLAPEGLEGFDQILCSSGDVEIGKDGQLIDDIPPHSSAGEKVVHISRKLPEWMDADGTVPENCPRNPGFDASQELGCFSCAQANLVYAGGNHIIVAPRQYQD